MAPLRPDVVGCPRHRSRTPDPEAGALLLDGVARAFDTVVARAEEHRGTLVIGRTHGVHAEPTTFGLKLAGWAFELDRDRARLESSLEELRVGKLSGAVGTYAATGPELERLACERLGLEPAPHSTQIIQRDRHAQLLSTLAVIASSLDAFALEIRHLARTEVREVEEPFGRGQKGSSAMPHKRNPITAERICGLARVVRAPAQVGLENVALWHERDISHSSAERVVVPDAFLALDYMLDRFTWLVEGLVVHPAGCARISTRATGSSSASASCSRSSSLVCRATRRTRSCKDTRWRPGTKIETFPSSSAPTPRSRTGSISSRLRSHGVHASRRRVFDRLSVLKGAPVHV